LADVLWEIHQQTDFKFIYSTDDIKTVRISSLNIQNASLEEVLALCLGPNGLIYNVSGDVITISRAPQTQIVSSEPVKIDEVVVDDIQQITATGTVISSADNLPVIGATVYQKGNLSNGVITDIDGNFSITVPADAVLVISSMGYQTVEKNPVAKMRVILKDEAQLLDAVVFVGYGVQRKESVVGAIAQVDNEALVNSGTTNITQAIAGKLSGVLAMQSGGTPGANDATIVIRGVSSWNGSDPLVMVDGVERSFSSIDPNEVETISVLKDASATAVFGAKGANGVILVTTKQGKKGKPKLNISASHGLNFIAGLPKHVDAVTTAVAYNYALMNQRNFTEIFSDKEIA
jgi:TonB-dependent SusC/RagA subfamily outer membrane receptor